MDPRYLTFLLIIGACYADKREHSKRSGATSYAQIIHGHHAYHPSDHYRTYTKEVAVPYPVPVEKRIPYPVKVPVAVPIDRPIPVHVPKPYPVPVVTPVPYPVEKPVPYPVKVFQPVVQPYYVAKLPLLFQPYGQYSHHQEQGGYDGSNYHHGSHSQ